MNFYIKTFGCQMNKADSESIAALLIKAGHEQTESPDTADLIVINTCNVRDHAVRRLRGHVRSIKPLSEAGNKPWIAIGGCVGEIELQGLFSSMPQTDVVFGTSSFLKLPDALDALEAGDRRIVLSDSDARIRHTLPSNPVDQVREWLPISRGCNNFCSYCIVPYARGREYSLPFDEIVSQASDFASRGVKEITLLGQNVNSYGNDRGESDAFAALLRRLDSIAGLERLRFLTSHPKDMSDATIAAISECEKVCEYVHLPLQAGSNSVLSRMNRRYDYDSYLKLIDKLRASIPGVALSTDLIVGFPGETGDDYNLTLKAVQEIRYDAAYTFMYSPRRGTEAAKMDDSVPADEKESRVRRLIELQSKISLEKNEELIEKTVEVFIERPSRRSNRRLAGRTRTNKIVNCLADTDLTNRFVNVKINGATPASLKGTVCGVIE